MIVDVVDTVCNVQHSLPSCSLSQGFFFCVFFFLINNCDFCQCGNLAFGVNFLSLFLFNAVCRYRLSFWDFTGLSDVDPNDKAC